MLPLLRGYEEGPLTVTPEATAIVSCWACGRAELRIADSTAGGMRTSALWTASSALSIGIGCHGCALYMPIGPVVASRKRPSGMHGGRARGGTAREIVLRKEQSAK